MRAREGSGRQSSGRELGSELLCSHRRSLVTLLPPVAPGSTAKPQLNQPIFNRLLYHNSSARAAGLPYRLFPSGKAAFFGPKVSCMGSHSPGVGGKLASTPLEGLAPSPRSTDHRPRTPTTRPSTRHHTPGAAAQVRPGKEPSRSEGGGPAQQLWARARAQAEAVHGGQPVDATVDAESVCACSVCGQWCSVARRGHVKYQRWYDYLVICKKIIKN